ENNEVLEREANQELTRLKTVIFTQDPDFPLDAWRRRTEFWLETLESSERTISEQRRKEVEELSARMESIRQEVEADYKEFLDLQKLIAAEERRRNALEGLMILTQAIDAGYRA